MYSFYTAMCRDMFVDKKKGYSDRIRKISAKLPNRLRITVTALERTNENAHGTR